jgi:oligopeptidase A
MQNPLLPGPTNADGALLFDRVLPQHAKPALEVVLAAGRGEGDPLVQLVYGAITQIAYAVGTPEWRAAYRSCLTSVTPFREEILAAHGLPSAASGETNAEEAARRLGSLSLRLAELQARFDENVVDAAGAWSKHVVDEPKLAGMTRQAKDVARRSSRGRGLEGFRLTLLSPSYESVMRHADDRELRREIYEAHTTLASDRGPMAGRFDNGPLIDEILALRHEKARLLGFQNHADALARRQMATSAEDAERFLLELNARVRPRAQAELDEIWGLAKSRDAIKGFRPWDLPYYAEEQRRTRRGFSEEELSAYLSAPVIFQALSTITTRLYDIQVEPSPDAPTWHPDVIVYRLRKAGEPAVLLYLDLYARESKRSGAWTAGTPGEPSTHRPSAIAFASCNFSPPSAGEPALLNEVEVDTLLSAWGRVLHSVATGTRIPDASAVRYESPAGPAESPGRALRGALRQRMAECARHVSTGEPPPAAILEHLARGPAPRPALDILRDVELALFDLRVHRDYVPAERSSKLRSQVLDTFAQARREVSLLPPPPWNRGACSFQEAFGQSSDAGYCIRAWDDWGSVDSTFGDGLRASAVRNRP